MSVARQNCTSSVFPNFCFLSTAKSSTMWTPTHTWKILWENTDSWDQKLVGEYFPLSLFISWGKAFEVCSMWFFRWAPGGQSPGIPSGTQLSNATFELAFSHPCFTHSVPWGDTQKRTHISVGGFQTSHLSLDSAQISDRFIEEGLGTWTEPHTGIFCLFPHLIVGEDSRGKLLPHLTDRNIKAQYVYKT